jgi:Tfp pilus assembly protein PilV
MFSIICKNKRGASSLIESIIAIVLVTIGLFAFLSLQPTSWKASAKSDYVGRGIMILNKELMAQELWIMNPCNTVAVGTVNKTVYASSQETAQSGDAIFTVRTITSAVTGTTNTWKVTVTVSWPPLNVTGVTDSISITRQESFRFGCI